MALIMMSLLTQVNTLAVLYTGPAQRQASMQYQYIPTYTIGLTKFASKILRDLKAMRN